MCDAEEGFCELRSCAPFCARHNHTIDHAGVFISKQKRPRRARAASSDAPGLCTSLLALFVMLVQRKLIYYPTKLSPQVAEQLAQQEGFIRGATPPARSSAGTCPRKTLQRPAS